MLDEKLVMLKNKLIEYSGLIESMVGKSVNGLLFKDFPMLKDVIDNDEPKANAFEIELDDMCTALIAQYQPAARDLRTILMVLKMNNDLERMGDHAVNISESARFLLERPEVKPLIDIPRMSEVVQGMFKDSIGSFVNSDTRLATEVRERDYIVDEFKAAIMAELSAIMNVDPSTIERSLHLIRITGNLERIADLSTNICEDVMFMVEGKVIKHHHEEPSLK